MNKRCLFYIPRAGSIAILLGQNSASLLTKIVNPGDLVFSPSCLSPNLVMKQSSLNPKLVMSGELGINPLLFDANFPTFDLSREEFEAVGVLVRGVKSVSGWFSTVSELLGSVIKTQGDIPESMNMNVMASSNHECENVSKNVVFQ